VQIEYLVIAKYLIVFGLFAAGCQIDLVNKSVADGDQQQSKADTPFVESDLPFTGGWFVYLSYELVGQIEPTLKKDLLLGDQPVAIAVRIPTAIVVDHHQQQTYLLDQFDNQQRIDQTLSDISQLQGIQSSPIQGALVSEHDSKFINGVEEIMLKFSNCAKAEKGAGLDFFSVISGRHYYWLPQSALHANHC
jgi:anthranilate/para-aminobenzoate synthase component I